MDYHALLVTKNGVWKARVRREQQVTQSSTHNELRAILAELANVQGDTQLGGDISALSPGSGSPDQSVDYSVDAQIAENGFEVAVTMSPKSGTDAPTTLRYAYVFTGSETATKRRTTLRDALAQIALLCGHAGLSTAIAGITP